MKTVFTLVCILSAVHYAAAQCSALKTYTTELVPACDTKDVYIKWPNYANQSTYYTCFGVANPVVTPCPSGSYFIYVYQQCGSCGEYIPAVQCENLKTQNTPNCVAIGSSAANATTSVTVTQTTPIGGYPTPNYPSTAAPTSNAPATTSTESNASTNSTASTASTTLSGPPVATPPIVTSSPTSNTTAFPGPPSPVTSSTNVPMPPTPAPTPPNIDDQPPTAAASSR